MESGEVSFFLILASFSLLVIFSLFYLLFSKKKSSEKNEPEARVRAGVAPPRRAQLARNRGIRLRAAQQQHNENIQNPDDDSEPEANTEISDVKMGAKKRAKLEAKAEKKAQREAEEQIRLKKKETEKQLEEERKKAEEKEKAEQKKREDEEKRLRELKEKKEHEEYLKMKEVFVVEEEGFEEGDEDSQNLLQEFVNYIKSNKVVIIEDLAAHFKLKTQAALDRIKDLQNDNLLTGVIDDRGKFIYVSQDEMEAVVKFIKQRGRISITELVENSNKLINMTPLSSS